MCDIYWDCLTIESEGAMILCNFGSWAAHTVTQCHSDTLQNAKILRKFNVEVFDLGLSKLNRKCGKALTEGTLKGVVFNTWFYFTFLKIIWISQIFNCNVLNPPCQFHEQESSGSGDALSCGNLILSFVVTVTAQTVFIARLTTGLAVIVSAVHALKTAHVILHFMFDLWLLSKWVLLCCCCSHLHPALHQYPWHQAPAWERWMSCHRGHSFDSQVAIAQQALAA